VYFSIFVCVLYVLHCAARVRNKYDTTHGDPGAWIGMHLHTGVSQCIKLTGVFRIFRTCAKLQA